MKDTLKGLSKRPKCEECGEAIINDLWGMQVQKGLKSEFHYFCSEEHTTKWAEKQPCITDEISANAN